MLLNCRRVVQVVRWEVFDIYAARDIGREVLTSLGICRVHTTRRVQRLRVRGGVIRRHDVDACMVWIRVMWQVVSSWSRRPMVIEVVIGVISTLCSCSRSPGEDER